MPPQIVQGDSPVPATFSICLRTLLLFRAIPEVYEPRKKDPNGKALSELRQRAEKFLKNIIAKTVASLVS